MVEIKLKDNCSLTKMKTSYGVVIHDWREFDDGVHIYKEMEIKGGLKPLPIDPKPVPVVDPKPNKEIVPEPKVKVVKKFKKKRSKKKVK